MIVMKFGGTSVQGAAAIDRAAAIVRGRQAEKPVVVVSALSKVTDALLATGRAAGGGDRDGALELARSLRERHYNTASELLGTGVFTGFHGELEAEFDALDELLRGIAAVGELTRGPATWWFHLENVFPARLFLLLCKRAVWTRCMWMRAICW